MICLFVLLFVGRVGAQCPVDTLILNNQNAVDKFSTNYPNCTELKFPLTITGDISNLEGLLGIRKAIEIEVIATTNLSSIEGLLNLEFVSVLKINENNDLIEIDNFAKLQKVDLLKIENNIKLEKINGFHELTNCNAIAIKENNSLTEILFLPKLKKIHSLEISLNQSLRNLSGFNSLKSAVSINISDNEELENLNELDSLIDCVNLIIRNNSKLTSFFSSGNINKAIQNLTIQNNKELQNTISIGCNNEFRQVLIVGNLRLNRIELNKCNKNYTDFNLTINSNPNLKEIIVDLFLNINRLIIEDNDRLTNIGSFSKIIEIRECRIVGNDSLKNISFAGAEIIQISNLKVEENNSLEIIDLTNSFDFYSFSLFVSNNNKLERIRIPKILKMYSLILANNEQLKEIEFDNLNVVDFISIDNNSSLENLNGMAKIKETVNLSIIQNNKLVSLKGLSNLKSIFGKLDISYNNSLVSLFDNLINASGFSISNNPELIDISGLRNINISTNISVVNNPNLSNCSILSICRSFDSNDITKYFYANNTNCENAEMVKESCKMNGEMLYPCPTRFSINFTSFTFNQPQNINIFDIYGHKIIELITSSSEVDISALTAGTYILHVESEDVNYKKKFIKY